MTTIHSKRATCWRSFGLGLAVALCVPVAAGAADSGVIKGTVKFEGAAPKMKKIKMDAESSCKAYHEKLGDTPCDDSVVVNKNNTLCWTVVYVKSSPAVDGKTFPVPAEAITLDQRGCQYHQHVWSMMVGQKLSILNSDENVLHNIHAFSEKSNGFNKGMPGAPGLKIDETFKESETPVKIKCDVHGWMTSWAFVLPHPFHSTTNDQGAFEIKGLPAGDYTIEAWHEKLGTQTQTVKVGDGETKELTFTYKGEADAGASPEASPSPAK